MLQRLAEAGSARLRGSALAKDGARRCRPAAGTRDSSGAREMLKPASYPENFPELPKLQALAGHGRRLYPRRNRARKAIFSRPPINVTFESGVNHVGVWQDASNGNGDDVTGSNDGAKNSTLMNYLPDARNHGAEIYTELCVRRIEQSGDGKWRVHYQLLGLGRERFDAPTLRLPPISSFLPPACWAAPRSCCARRPPASPCRIRSAPGSPATATRLPSPTIATARFSPSDYGAHDPQDMDLSDPASPA